MSTARRPIGMVELDEILKVSRRNNLATNVTGLLLAGERRFLQALEGPSLGVLLTLERIKKDARHFAFVELSREQIDQRVFDGWAMAVHRTGSTCSDRGLSPEIAQRLRQISDVRVRGYFDGFAQRQAAA